MRILTRRDFLKSGAIAASAITAGLQPLPVLFAAHTKSDALASVSSINLHKTGEKSSWLRVKGKQIVTENDKPFLLAGIGYCRDVIISAQDDAVMQFCISHHLNMVRLAFYTQLFNNEPGHPINIDDHIKNFINPVVTAAKKAGIYVILDDHEYFHQIIDEKDARGVQKSKIWDDATVTNWIACWTKVASAYRDEPTVMGYELQNEPNGMEPGMVRDFYTRCLKAIRNVDQRHIIIVGSDDWSHARSMASTWAPVASTIDKPYNNVVFSFHDYPGDNDPPVVRNYIVKFRDTYHVPVLCTEFGATWWQHSEAECRAFEIGMLELFSNENIGWSIWALTCLVDNPKNQCDVPDHHAMGPPPTYDSCAYSDIWPSFAQKMTDRNA